MQWPDSAPEKIRTPFCNAQNAVPCTDILYAVMAIPPFVLITEPNMNNTIEQAPAGTVTSEQEDIRSRRAFLRGTLMVGCSLLVPAALYRSAPALADTGVKKLAQSGVKYQSHPNGSSKCSGCANFIAASGSCKMVEGKISPDGWCILWSKKA